MVNLIVITHGEFGAYLVEAAEEIVGRQEEGVRCMGISPRLSIDEVRARLAATVSELREGEGLIIATDMPGGTPGNVAMPLVKAMPRVNVISGVNLYMLVTAFNYRKSATLEDLTERMIAAGKKSIVDMRALLLTRR